MTMWVLPEEGVLHVSMDWDFPAIWACKKKDLQGIKEG